MLVMAVLEAYKAAAKVRYAVVALFSETASTDKDLDVEVEA